MKSDPANFAILPLAESHLPGVIQLAESLEPTPHWPLDSYTGLTAGTSPRVTLVAQDALTAEVAGFVIARLTPPEAELESIGVEAAFQRQGLGGRLVKAVIEALDGSRIARLYLEVRASNAPALALYRRLGFVETGRRPGYYANPREDAVLMELRLR